MLFIHRGSKQLASMAFVILPILILAVLVKTSLAYFFIKAMPKLYHSMLRTHRSLQNCFIPC